MEKILVSVYIPSVEKNYEIWFPINITVGKIIELLQKAVCELTQGSYQVRRGAILYDKRKMQPISYGEIVKTSGLQNGSSVILI